MTYKHFYLTLCIMNVVILTKKPNIYSFLAATNCPFITVSTNVCMMRIHMYTHFMLRFLHKEALSNQSSWHGTHAQ